MQRHLETYRNMEEKVLLYTISSLITQKLSKHKIFISFRMSSCQLNEV